MEKRKTNILTFLLAFVGVIIVIIGVMGLFLPIIPGIVLIILGLWFIKQHYEIHFINKLFTDLRKLKNKTKNFIEKRKKIRQKKKHIRLKSK